MSEVAALLSAYYCADWLEGRIINLLEQTLHPQIIAVCKDGSEEQSILKRYGIEPCWETNDVPTLYKAWNIAIESSESDYLMVANSDDRLAKFATLQMSTILDNPDIGLVYPDFWEVESEFGDPVRAYELGEGDLRKGCYVGAFPMWRRSLHDKYGYFNESYQVAGDWDMWLRFQTGGEKFCHVKEKLGRYWNRGDNLEYKKNDRLIWEQARIKRAYDKI